MGGGRRESGQWDSQGGGEPRSEGGRKSMGGGRRESGQWGSQGGGDPGVKEEGSQWEEGEERVGSGITKVGGRLWEVGFPRWGGTLE